MQIKFREYTICALDTSRVADVFRLFEENRSRLEDYFAGTIGKTKTIEATKIYCEEIVERVAKKEYFPYVIMDSASSKFIGWIDLKNIDWKIPKAEIGYFIDKSHTGKGIISEGVSLVIEAINHKYNFKKLLLRIGNDNPKSAKIALYNQFELEGTIRRDYLTTSGKLVDLQYFGRIF